MDKKIDKQDYYNWIHNLKSKIHAAQTKVALSLNSQLLELYWEIGKDITERQENTDWGSKFIEQTAIELKNEFPEMRGFSRRNLYAIRQWYKFYSEKYQFVPQSVAQIPWGHNRLIISKTKDIDEAEFYCNETIKNGWDRDTLEIQITNKLFFNKGAAITNFPKTLPATQSKLAEQALKDPYNFDFLGLQNDALERAIEDELVKNITKFLLELGKGFAFLGRQYKIEVSETDYFIDLMFYHLDLRCYIVVELKAGKFKPEYAGKLNFYLSAVDSQIKKPEDNQTIGILLCKKKDKIEAEYTLRDINKPMGISEYKLTDAIPENIKTKLPSIEELENELMGKLNTKND
ncbi:PDDEXK nuclease domain-containing protein [Aequorivita todarodis]|uniref:PDDEXK nuclease domain-containing protein n=1 Tax=Aequorivita todarodis TaxID=2036821 RepID=UPI00234FBC54|nr:PDDEXK nuclease domain-containing protein [Aequorivita todarodis]MDC8002272.1 PDDEXK nuclease domain-containing protein [Aequorivita todarodis]